MKIKLLLILLVLAFGTHAAFAQNSQAIAAIQAEVRAIEKNAAKYTKKTKDVEGISLEGTQATYFVSGRGLKKIAAKMYGETYNATVELYYQGEELIFAFYKFNRYDTQIGLEKPPKVVNTEEKRFYFVGGKLEKLLVGKKEVKSDDEQFSDSENDIVDLSKKLKDAYQ